MLSARHRHHRLLRAHSHRVALHDITLDASKDKEMKSRGTPPPPLGGFITASWPPLPLQHMLFSAHVVRDMLPERGTTCVPFALLTRILHAEPRSERSCSITLPARSTSSTSPSQTSSRSYGVSGQGTASKAPPPASPSSAFENRRLFLVTRPYYISIIHYIVLYYTILYHHTILLYYIILYTIPYYYYYTTSTTI